MRLCLNLSEDEAAAHESAFPASGWKRDKINLKCVQQIALIVGALALPCPEARTCPPHKKIIVLIPNRVTAN
ncbi:hypothetical protein [Calothrix anomala]|uniref:hypothetical protein n=1 Tax=Calothrix anomala TaxID=212351 RepID=UPI0030DCDE67